MYGIKEDKDAVMWLDKVDDLPKYVAGRAVGVSDMYRIGGKYVVCVDLYLVIVTS